MGVMGKMRESTKYILWVLIISFGLLWGLSDTRVFDAMMAGPRSLGEVNGDPIKIEEYNQRVQYYTQQFNENNQGGTITPEMRTNFEKRAWEDLVSNKLMQQKMKDLGITVTDAELVEMITGENPDPFIKQQFQREDGTINRQALQQAIEAEENTQLWVMIEQQLRQKRRRQKMNNFIQSGLVVSEAEIKEEFKANNTFADVEFVRFPYADVSEDQVVVSDDEIQSYYNNNSSEFQRKESYRFEYVSFSKAPTAKDTARIVEEVTQLRDEFAQAENDSLFLVQQQSNSSYNDAFVKKEDLRDSYKPVLELEEGEVSDVIVDNGRVRLLKLNDARRDEVKFTDFNYRITADPIATVDKQAEEADDFTFFARDEGFESEANRRELEIKSGQATKGQPFIPGIGQSQQIMDFLTSNASEGSISDPIELNEQFVVIKITDVIPAGTRPLDEVRSQIVNKLKIEKRKELAYEQAKELASTHSNLQGIADASGKEIVTAEDVRKSSSVLASVGREPEIVGAIFGLEEGNISQPLKGNSAVFVIKLNEIDEADVSQMTQNEKQQIRQQLSQQKTRGYMQVWIEELKEEADIEDYRQSVLQS